VTDLAEALCADPKSILDCSYGEQFTLSREQIDAIHLAGARKRFGELRPQLVVLDKLATEQGIDEIRTLDDLAPLLFPHTVYKSYPLSSIERNRYDRMTKWLSGLSTADLSGVDSTGVESIDDWLDRLDQGSDLRVFHTSGTSGKLSFLPRTLDVWKASVTIVANALRDWNGPRSAPDHIHDGIPIIYPGYRYGASAAIRGAQVRRDLIGLGEDNFLYLYPQARMSADVTSLAGRMRLAETRGEQGSVAFSPALLKRRDEILALEADRPAQMHHFFEQAEERFGGRDVHITAVWPILFDWASEGLKRGFDHIFGPQSMCLSGGGSKGTVLPENYREQVYDFLGFDRIFEMYATSELTGLALQCAEGNYHFTVTTIPFVLDPETGNPLPRKDPQHGRMALFDTVTDCYWAGLVTGDEVTVTGWDTPCACGRTGPHLVAPIRRYSEAQGGDDKINCAGAPEAHDKAMAALAALSN
jgi:hypothetical protein